jgi:hypothetical protein
MKNWYSDVKSGKAGSLPRFKIKKESKKAKSVAKRIFKDGK